LAANEFDDLAGYDIYILLYEKSKVEGGFILPLPHRLAGCNVAVIDYPALAHFKRISLSN